MKVVLVYCWKAVSEPAILKVMKCMGIKVVILDSPMKDYHADADFAQKCMRLIREKAVNIIFSYDYFPLLSMIAETLKLPYISWIYDCPMYTLLSRTMCSLYNYIFCFDYQYALRLKESGGRNVYHFPLGTDVQGFEEIILGADEEKKQDYKCDISFVGNFYNDENNLYRKITFEPYVGGYLEGIIAAQQKVYGYNLLRETLCENFISEIISKCDIKLSEFYSYSERELAVDVLGKEVSAREREEVLYCLGHRYSVDIYTGAELPERLKKCKGIHNRSKADYQQEMPIIFRESKVNLNITSKTIETGISQRVLDILACGGFCLTNYQKEIADYFEDGKELVMYTDMKDLMEKAAYYLVHDEERKQIAFAGQGKVREFFDIHKRVRELFSCIDALN